MNILKLCDGEKDRIGMCYNKFLFVELFPWCILYVFNFEIYVGCISYIFDIGSVNLYSCSILPYL